MFMVRMGIITRHVIMEVEEFSINYLERLNSSGYFSRQHVICDGVYFADEVACKNIDNFEKTKRYLVENNYLEVSRTVLSEDEKLVVHPKDYMDYWFFILTDKGKLFLK